MPDAHISHPVMEAPLTVDDGLAIVRRIDHGRVPRAILGSPKQYGPAFFLLHGGAGPADPKGDQALRARATVERIARTVRESAAAPLSDFHARGLDARNLTGAERTALLAARLLEEEPIFNSGYGAALQGDGVPRVSSGLMESRRGRFSAVMNVPDLLRPSELALHLQAERFSCLDSLGALALARDLGVPCTDLVTPARFDRWLSLRRESMEARARKADGKGTIGCVGLDAQGHLCAVTSTGGVGNETPGRVGDTPTVAGNYCSARVAVSCTGYGEQILSLGFASRLATRVDDGVPLVRAMERGIAEAHERGFGLAAIAVGLEGDEAVWCVGTTEGYFLWAGFDGRAPLVFPLGE